MYCVILILGGLLIMMGQHARSEALFYYFKLEEYIPEDHLLRLIDKHISLVFVRERLKDSYSETGRPSIDPELLLRILLIGYLYGITSERKLVEELRMHLAWRWFTGLGFDQEIPHHSTFSKNRHGRFQASKLFEQLFEEIVRQCVEVGLVQGKHLSVDGSFVEANAAKESQIPREQLAEAAQVNYAVKQYLAELEEQNPVEEPVHEQEQVSTTDPDSTYATKGGTPARLGYYDNYLVDNQSCVNEPRRLPTAPDLGSLVRQLSQLKPDECGSVNLSVIRIPGKTIFVTEELLQSLPPHQESMLT